MSKITDSARGEICEVQLPGCPSPVEGVVWAHSNKLRHGKGVGKKSADIFGAYACNDYCHAIYDGQKPLPIGVSRDEVEDRFQAGHDRSLIKLIIKGLVVIKGMAICK